MDLDLDALAFAQAVSTFGWARIDEHKAGFDEFLDASAADVAEARSDLLIEALPCFAFGSDEFMNRGLVALSHAVIVAAPVNCALDALWSKEHGQNWMWPRGKASLFTQLACCLVTSEAWCLWKKRTSMMMRAAPIVMAESATLKAGQW